MKICRTLSRRTDYRGRSQVLLRLTVDHWRQFRLKSGIFINRRFWEGVGRCCRCERLEYAESMRALDELECRIFSFCERTSRGQLTPAALRACIAGEAASQADLPALVDDFLAHRDLSPSRLRQYRTLQRLLVRYGRHAGHAPTAEEIEADGAAALLAFARDEHMLAPQAPPRGHNTLVSLAGRVRTLLRWLAATGRLAGNLSRMPGPGAEVYGTPYYLCREELQAVAEADLSAEPRLEAQRDVFVFQCLTGCRVSDLRSLTPANIAEGALEYVAHKTRRLHPETVRVPLHPLAAAIVRRRARPDSLLPTIRPDAYNRAIRAVLERCGVVRAVSVLDPVSLTAGMRRICDVAGSHMARRTFAGCLYHASPDPALICSMTGHAPGSRSFARYRHIDDATKRSLLLQTFCSQSYRGSGQVCQIDKLSN